MGALGSEDFGQHPKKKTSRTRRQIWTSGHLSGLAVVELVTSDMKALLLALLLVSTLCPDTARSQNAVRLCGREFLRAVVYTCGGSRWRRVPSELSAEDTDLDAGQPLRVTERLRRSLDTLLPVVCCKVGCHKNDLALMC